MSRRTTKKPPDDLLFKTDLIKEIVEAKRSPDEDPPVPVPPGTALGVPAPQDFDLDTAATFASKVVAHAKQCDDIGELDDMRARIAAIETYLSRRNEKAARALAVADRELEVRIGVLLGPAQVGGDRRSDQVGRDQPDPLTKDQRHDFRKMASHRDDPEVADAIKSGASRSQVLRLIDAGQHPADPDLQYSPLPVSSSAVGSDGGGPPRPVIEATSIEHPTATNTTDPHTVEAPRAAEGNPGPTQASASAAVITTATRTLECVADELDHAEPGHVTTDTLRSLVDSMTASLRRIERFHRRMKDWIG